MMLMSLTDRPTITSHSHGRDPARIQVWQYEQDMQVSNWSHGPNPRYIFAVRCTHCGLVGKISVYQLVGNLCHTRSGTLHRVKGLLVHGMARKGRREIEEEAIRLLNLTVTLRTEGGTN